MSLEDFRATYEAGFEGGYRVVGLFDEGAYRAAAGFHITYGFLHGRFMYIDDLVTTSEHRSKGYGRKLNEHLVDLARREGCNSVQLDSGTHRTDAHRFYLRERYDITSFHFVRKIST
jgi:GNAT superfamily N-acetyltransferase